MGISIQCGLLDISVFTCTDLQCILFQNRITDLQSACFFGGSRARGPNYKKIFRSSGDGLVSYYCHEFDALLFNSKYIHVHQYYRDSDRDSGNSTHNSLRHEL